MSDHRPAGEPVHHECSAPGLDEHLAAVRAARGMDPGEQLVEDPAPPRVPRLRVVAGGAE